MRGLDGNRRRDSWRCRSKIPPAIVRDGILSLHSGGRREIAPLVHHSRVRRRRRRRLNLRGRRRRDVEIRPLTATERRRRFTRLNRRGFVQRHQIKHTTTLLGRHRGRHRRFRGRGGARVNRRLRPVPRRILVQLSLVLIPNEPLARIPTARRSWFHPCAHVRLPIRVRFGVPDAFHVRHLRLGPLVQRRRLHLGYVHPESAMRSAAVGAKEHSERRRRPSRQPHRALRARQILRSLQALQQALLQRLLFAFIARHRPLSPLGRFPVVDASVFAVFAVFARLLSSSPRVAQCDSRRRRASDRARRDDRLASRCAASDPAPRDAR